MRYTEFRSKSVESVKLWRMQLGGSESAYSLEHVLFRQSRQIVDLPISVHSASWFFCLGICISLSISPWWYGADKKRFLPQQEQLFDSSQYCVFCLAVSL